MTAPRHVRPLREADLPPIRAIMEASLERDRLPGFTPHDIERALARIAPDPAGTVVAEAEGVVVGYCTPRHHDLTVHPDHRRAGHARRLFAAACELANRRGEGPLELYVPADVEAAAAFAAAMGLTYRSSLWQFRLGPEIAVPPPAFDREIVHDHWQPDQDVDAWVAFVEASFAGHPSPLQLDPEVVRAVNARPDFDPSGILILACVVDPGRPIAFTRVEMVAGSEPATGSVNLIGVLPEWRGRGLGRELLRWAIRDLRRRGASVVELAVEAANERATLLYRRHGFEPTVEWPRYLAPA